MADHTRDPADVSWRKHANCLGVDPDLFYPERGASTREAKNVCKGCVVLEQCLEYALTHNEIGIWGGTSQRQRKALLRARRRTMRAAS